MKTIAFMLAAALAAAGCGKKTGSACSDAANTAIDRMAAGRGSATPPPAIKDALDKLKGVIAKRCTEDKWSDEVIDCYAKAGNMADIKSCRGKLPPELGQKLLAEQMQVMMSAGGDGMMHGAPPPMPPEPGPATPPAAPPPPVPAPAGSSGP